jgi:hypothetical protein
MVSGAWFHAFYRVYRSSAMSGVTRAPLDHTRSGTKVVVRKEGRGRSSPPPSSRSHAPPVRWSFGASDAPLVHIPARQHDVVRGVVLVGFDLSSRIGANRILMLASAMSKPLPQRAGLTCLNMTKVMKARRRTRTKSVATTPVMAEFWCCSLIVLVTVTVQSSPVYPAQRGAVSHECLLYGAWAKASPVAHPHRRSTWPHPYPGRTHSAPAPHTGACWTRGTPPGSLIENTDTPTHGD